MTDKQMQFLASGLKEAGKAQFAQPQQAAILKAVLTAHGVQPAKASEIAVDYAPFFNASAMLQTLKKLGIVANELTAGQKAQAEALAKALKS